MDKKETLSAINEDVTKVKHLRKASENLLKQTEETADKAEQAVLRDIEIIIEE